jgi:predicted Fe-Mo cluster-binding NifX family protein
MGKSVVTSSGNSLESKFDRRFGRAAWFCLFNEDNGEVKFYENDNLNSSHGAGTKAAEKMVELEATKIISGDFGPKARDVLEKFNIQMVIIQDDDSTIQNIIEKIKS